MASSWLSVSSICLWMGCFNAEKMFEICSSSLKLNKIGVLSKDESVYHLTLMGNGVREIGRSLERESRFLEVEEKGVKRS